MYVCVCVCNSKNPIKLISLPNPNPQIHDNPKTKPTHKSQQNYLRPCYFLNFSLSLIAFLSNIPNPFQFSFFTLPLSLNSSCFPYLFSDYAQANHFFLFLISLTLSSFLSQVLSLNKSKDSEIPTL